MRKCAVTDLSPFGDPNTAAHNAENSYVLRYRRLTANAFGLTPVDKSETSFELRSAYEYILIPNAYKIIKTDLNITIPRECCAFVVNPTGQLMNKFVAIYSLLVNTDMMGNTGVVLFNYSNTFYRIRKGDCIA